MKNNIILVILIFSFFSCKKQSNESCISPTNNDLQGEWKQDYFLDPNAFAPPPEWERIIFRNDSFFMKIVIRPEQLDSLNCYEKKWNEYAKGTFLIDNYRITFDGVLTDSLYKIKTGGCHESGPYKSRVGINFCGQSFTLNILSNDTIVKGDKFKITMLKLN